PSEGSDGPEAHVGRASIDAPRRAPEHPGDEHQPSPSPGPLPGRAEPVVAPLQPRIEEREGEGHDEAREDDGDARPAHPRGSLWRLLVGNGRLVGSGRRARSSRSSCPAGTFFVVEEVGSPPSDDDSVEEDAVEDGSAGGGTAESGAPGVFTGSVRWTMSRAS